MDLTESEKADLRVNRATTTPLWKGFATLVKYRTTRNYRNPEFLGPRIGDKIIFTFLIGTLYLGIGDKLRPDNYINIGAVLFMWCTMPAYAPLRRAPCMHTDVHYLRKCFQCLSCSGSGTKPASPYPNPTARSYVPMTRLLNVCRWLSTGYDSVHTRYTFALTEVHASMQAACTPNNKLHVPQATSCM